MASEQMTVWADRLRVAASMTLGQEPSQGISDSIEGPTGLLRMARLVAVSLGQSTTAIEFVPSTLDERLWASLIGLGKIPEPPTESTGALSGEPAGLAIEVWTEIELAAVHAGWSIGGPWQRAAKRAAAWLVEHVQPDNATNRPWAVHVFAELAEQLGDTTYELYAQTLLHNCQVGTGKPDQFSAMILLHASDQLQAC
jgi:hypothetical protein